MTRLRGFAVAFLSILALAFGSPAYAQQGVIPVALEIQGLQISANSVVGNLIIKNPNPLSYESAYYVVKLQGEDIVGTDDYKGQKITRVTQGPLINHQTSEKFSLTSGDSKQVSLNIPFASSVKAGNYQLEINLFDGNNLLLGSLSRPVDLSGTGNFLEIKSCVIVADNVEYSPTVGPNVAPGAQVYGKCAVSNPGTTSISALPQADYAINSVVGYEGSDKQVFSSEKAVNFPARSTINVIIPLPSLQKPQVYEALAYFKGSGGAPASTQIAFRWVVAGESSTIRSITLDKSDYRKGQVAKVTVGADPSMDLFWKGGGPAKEITDTTDIAPFVQPKLQGTPLENASVSVQLKDSSGQVCGTSEKNVDVDPNQNIWPDQVLDVTLDSDCSQPVVVATIKNNGKELAVREVKAPVIVSGDKIVNNSARNWVIGLAIIFILVLIGAGYYYWKKKKLPPPLKPPATTVAALLIILGLGLGFRIPGLDSLSIVGEACAAEIPPGTPISIDYNGIKAFRPNQACPGPDWKGQPQYSDGAGGCVLDIVSGHDQTNFTYLDTKDQIRAEDGVIKANISGQFKGFGCGNTTIGLIVRATVNGTSEGVQINGGGSKAFFDNLAQNGGGAGTSVNLDLTITSANDQFCGPLDVKLELIPFIKHIGIVASDLAEDQLLTDTDTPGWTNLTYTSRTNCGAAGQSCWGVLQKSIDGGFCAACNATCSNDTDCTYAADGCTSCLPSSGGAASGGGTAMTCQPPPPPACNSLCESNEQCAQNQDGCVECVAGSCRVPPACNVSCSNDQQCAQATDGCTACVNGACKIPPACNVSCSDSSDCARSTDGCTQCLPGDTGTDKVCRPAAACNVACTKDSQCAGAKDGCTACVDGACKIPPACGTACTTKAECSGAKDGCSECMEGSCTDYSDNMCKCDGMVAELNYPNDFKFQAFGKVEGSDTQKAEIADITFRMTQDNQVIAKSNPITPEIVENSDSKIRFKADWQTAAPQISQNSTYRVFADVRCKPKRIVADASVETAPVAAVEPEKSLPAPKGLVFIFDMINKVFGGNGQVEAFTGKVLAQLSTPTPTPQAGSNLQLKTLNFVKLMDTDNCRFVMFKFDESLF